MGQRVSGAIFFHVSPVSFSDRRRQNGRSLRLAYLMWIVRLALNRPLTFIVMAIAIMLLTPVALVRTPTDIFPKIDIPVISMVFNFGGLSPTDIEQRVAGITERYLTTTVNDIEHIESQSYNGIAVIKVFFHPSANIQTALAQVTSAGQSVGRQMPAGSPPPLVVIYSASTVPVVQIALMSNTLSEQQLFDSGNTFIRQQLATVQGASIPQPYGGKQRAISIDLNPTVLQQNGLSPVDISTAVASQNLVTPSGSAKFGSTEYLVELNGSPQTIEELNNIPVRTQNGATLYLRDIAHVRDGFGPQTNIVRANGQRGVLMSVYKTGNASTLDIVSRVKSTVARAAESLPPELRVTALFDQSIFVRAAVSGVVREALIAAALTAIMILIFLGDWRSTMIIAISIPLSIMVSLITLAALGETINIMTLGGLALAVGILVDDASVTIENIDRNLAMGKTVRDAILDGSEQIAVPAFVSTICICIVFVPMFFLTGVARYLFVPLAEAVIFAMLASYILSRTLVPTMALYLIDAKHALPQRGFERAFERFTNGYRSILETAMHFRGAFVTVFAIFCLISLGFSAYLGRDFFPQVDAGQIRLHLRARSGLRIEETAKLTDQVEDVIRKIVAPHDLTTLLDNVGLATSGLNLSLSNTGTIGSSDSEILVQLSPVRTTKTIDYVRQLRAALPSAFPGTEFFFQPADIVSQILNFGAPAPIDVAITGTNQRANYAFAQTLAQKLRRIPGLVDMRVQQRFDAPTLKMTIDRSRAQGIGISARDVAQNVLLTLSSSFQTNPLFFVDPKNGANYPLAVQTPQYRITSMDELENTPIRGGTGSTQMLSNLVSMSPSTRAATASHYNAQPMINLYASVDGRDLGAVATEIERETRAMEKDLPKGSTINTRGQILTMHDSFTGLAIGLAAAIVLAYLLIVVNFQSWLDPIIIISALPGALAGIVWMLLFTHTTLSVPSLTGAIMCMGVATANSILVVSFGRERLNEGATSIAAAIDAGVVRLRPVLMTALAMIIGMIPMAIGMGEGGEQNAPLGRAVVGGLLVATAATLFVVPCLFAMAHAERAGWRGRKEHA